MLYKIHQPVMVQEVLESFQPSPSKVFLDCTFGRGGHTEAILSWGAKVYAIDRDDHAFLYGKGLECQNFAIKRARFSDPMKYNNIKFDGILFDFGVSSDQIENMDFGISFNSESELNMGMGMHTRSLYQFLNSTNEKTIADIIFHYGDEGYSRKIAKAICEFRKKKKIEYTSELVRIVEKIVPRRAIHPATKTFQALRIYINDELNEIAAGLNQAFNLLKDGGKLSCISFHSLEDSLVKNFAKFKNIKAKSITPSRSEILENRRSRSAKMRILIKSLK